jgi:putative addiction module component (TIGR02574 family)
VVIPSPLRRKLSENTSYWGNEIDLILRRISIRRSLIRHGIRCPFNLCCWDLKAEVFWGQIKGGVMMGMATDKLLEKALLFPADGRTRLVEKLLQSLNLPTEAEINRLWVEEAERRVSRIEDGKVEFIPDEQVFARIRAKYQR